MKTGDLARQFGVSSETIRNWTTSFSEFFSDSRTKQRIYTEADVLVLATIAKLSHEGYNLKMIYDRLQSGERVEHPGVANFGVDARMVPAAAVEQIIDATEIKVQLEKIILERDKLVEMLDKSGEKIQQLENRVEHLQDQIVLLQRELGRAEGELTYRRHLDERDQDTQDNR